MHKLPAPFTRYFDTDSLSAHPSTLVAIAPDGEIRWLNQTWYHFARANGGESALSRFTVGSNYFEGITSPFLRTFFERELGQAYAGTQIFEHEYECSSPDRRRLFRVRALPVEAGGLLLEHVQVHEGPIPHPSMKAEMQRYVNAHGLLVQCSNCRKVQRSDGRTWDWVREWVAVPHHLLSHGLCEVCFGFYWKPKLEKR